MVADITSKKLFAYPLQSGSMDHVMNAYNGFVEKDAGHTVASVSGDAFFSARRFKQYMLQSLFKSPPPLQRQTTPLVSATCWL